MACIIQALTRDIQETAPFSWFHLLLQDISYRCSAYFRLWPHGIGEAAPFSWFYIYCGIFPTDGMNVSGFGRVACEKQHHFHDFIFYCGIFPTEQLYFIPQDLSTALPAEIVENKAQEEKEEGREAGLVEYFDLLPVLWNLTWFFTFFSLCFSDSVINTDMEVNL